MSMYWVHFEMRLQRIQHNSIGAKNFRQPENLYPIIDQSAKGCLYDNSKAQAEA